MMDNEAGWEPMVCDTPVPYYKNGVPAGPPNLQDLPAIRICVKSPQITEQNFAKRPNGIKPNDQTILAILLNQNVLWTSLQLLNRILIYK